VVGVAMALFLCSFGYGGLTSFVAVRSDELGIPRSTFFVTFATTVFVTRVFSGRLADRVGHRRFLLPCLGLVTVGLGAAAAAETRWQLALAAAIFGLGFGNQYPAFVGHVIRYVDHRRRGAAFGGILAAFDTGVGTGSIAVGAMASRIGFGPAFGVAAGLSAFSIPYFIWAEKRFLERRLYPRPSPGRSAADRRSAAAASGASEAAGSAAGAAAGAGVIADAPPPADDARGGIA
jgi:MFS family permease